MLERESLEAELKENSNKTESNNNIVVNNNNNNSNSTIVNNNDENKQSENNNEEKRPIVMNFSIDFGEEIEGIDLQNDNQIDLQNENQNDNQNGNENDKNEEEKEEEEDNNEENESNDEEDGENSKIKITKLKNANRAKKFPSNLPPPPPIQFSSLSSPLSSNTNKSEIKRRKSLFDYLTHHLSSTEVKEKISELLHEEIQKQTSQIIDEYKKINEKSKQKNEHICQSFRSITDFVELFYSDETKEIIHSRTLKMITPLFPNNTSIQTWHYRDEEGIIYGWPEDIDVFVAEIKISHNLSRTSSTNLPSSHRISSMQIIPELSSPSPSPSSSPSAPSYWRRNSDEFKNSELNHSNNNNNNNETNNNNINNVQEEEIEEKKIELKSNRKTLIIVEMNFLKSHLGSLIKIVKLFSEKNPAERRFDVLILTFNVGNDVAVIVERMGFHIVLFSDYFN